MYPSYLDLYKTGELIKKVQHANDLLRSCMLCPRKCGINRAEDKKGFCQTGARARVYSYLPHFGEEPPISGDCGSGTIFFSGCNMACVYCQNYKFSQGNEGREVGVEELAQFMLELQDSGCHNINLVTPTHVLPQILTALSLAIPKGLSLPLVYNTSGYELPEMIHLLQGVIDIFLPDMRYAENKNAISYSHAPDYPRYNQAAVKQMYRQVGTAQIDDSRSLKRGIRQTKGEKLGARQDLINKGLIIRHLILPKSISGTAKIMRFIKQEISAGTYISLMSQYLPCCKANEFPELSRRIDEEEYTQAKEIMLGSGLSNGWLQESGGLAHLAGTNLKPR